MNRERVRSVVKRVAVWIPVLLLAFIFIPQGLAKFSDSSGWARAFRFWGYPDWFRVTIGVVELAAVLLLLWPRSAIVGASLIICVMLGGMGTHVVKEGGRHITSEVVPLVLATIVLLIRRRTARTALIGIGLVAVQASGTAAQANSRPTPQALFDQFISAVGGRSAIEAVRPRVTTGELIAQGGMRAPLEIYQAAPDRFLRVLRNTQVNLSQNGFDGIHTWSANDERTRDVDGPEVATLRREYHLHRPALLSRFYARFGQVQLDSVAGRAVYRVVATTTAL
jgi:uncharacterized membrane protein YphA (DoxX/SURF4 family)